jgi:hypothetical protein
MGCAFSSKYSTYVWMGRHQIDLPGFEELAQRDGGEDLGGASDGEDGVPGQRLAALQIRDAQCRAPDQLSTLPHGNGEAGDLPLLHESPKTLGGPLGFGRSRRWRRLGGGCDTGDDQ